MLDLDKETLKILNYIKIKGNNGVSWGILQEKFGRDSAGIFFLERLNREGYVVTKDVNGDWITFDGSIRNLDYRFVSYATPKTNALLENRTYEFNKWLIPTFISFLALAISIVSIIFAVI